jgi:hypothetical protein
VRLALRTPRPGRELPDRIVALGKRSARRRSKRRMAKTSHALRPGQVVRCGCAAAGGAVVEASSPKDCA